MAKKGKQGSFRFEKNDRIGAAGAEQDLDLLKHCFVDTGDLALLQNLSDHRVVLLGRTGTGKSALLSMLKERNAQHVISISPENLALTYVANSTILNDFAALGVNLDPFFKLLWRHVLTVEILSDYFSTQGPGTPRSLIDRLRERFSGPSKQDLEMRETIAYMETWGQKFWQKTEFRVREITNKVEQQLGTQMKAGLGAKAASLKGSRISKEILTETERAELVTRGQDIVSAAQVQDLTKVLHLLGTVLQDRQKHYYVVIDGLDENWVEDRLRYRMIMALIQTAKDFAEVNNAKVIVALRRDLIDRVFRLTRSSGFQEEKYRSLYLSLQWTQDQICEVLDKRITNQFSRRYTKQEVTHRDLLPAKYRKRPIGDFIYSMAHRPRDAIAFFNACIENAQNQPKLESKELKIAESVYSRERLRALADEWSSDYPTLLEFAKILQKKPSTLKVQDLSNEAIENICLEVAANSPPNKGTLEHNATQVIENVMTVGAFKPILVHAFYKVGLIGLKLAAHEEDSWADKIGWAAPTLDICDNTGVTVHPAYRRALGVIEKQ